MLEGKAHPSLDLYYFMVLVIVAHSETHSMGLSGSVSPSLVSVSINLFQINRFVLSKFFFSSQWLQMVPIASINFIHELLKYSLKIFLEASRMF